MLFCVFVNWMVLRVCQYTSNRVTEICFTGWWPIVLCVGTANASIAQIRQRAGGRGGLIAKPNLGAPPEATRCFGSSIVESVKTEQDRTVVSFTAPFFFYWLWLE